MAPQEAIQPLRCDWRRTAFTLFKPGKVIRRRYATEYAVGAARERSLVDDGIEHGRGIPVRFAPVLREDVVDVHVLIEEDGLLKLLTGAKVLSTFHHQKRIDALVRGRQTHPHRFQTVGAKQGLAYRGRLRTTL